MLTPYKLFNISYFKSIKIKTNKICFWKPKYFLEIKYQEYDRHRYAGHNKKEIITSNDLLFITILFNFLNKKSQEMKPNHYYRYTLFKLESKYLTLKEIIYLLERIAKLSEFQMPLLENHINYKEEKMEEIINNDIDNKNEENDTSNDIKTLASFVK
jgi:hypothetical protein